MAVKDSIVEQCQVICPGANFSEVGLDKYIINGCIVVAPDDDEDQETEPAFHAPDP